MMIIVSRRCNKIYLKFKPFPLDFLQKSSLHLESTPIQLRGLINNGNWCYINATLQSLLGCSAFYYLFKSMLPFKHKLGAASSTPLTDTM